MTILSTLADIATAIGIDVPSVIFTSTDREIVELRSTANRAAKAMAKHYDWQALKTLATVTGDGVLEDFALPTDYWRQINKATLWVASMPHTPLEHVTDTDTWLGIVTAGTTAIPGQWTIYGNQVHIRPAMASADTAKYFYITKNIVAPASGANKEAFTLDTDTFRLDEEVLGLEVIWRWKAQKGLPYAEEMRDAGIALEEAVARDKGSKILVVGTQRMPGGFDAVPPYPWTIS